LSGVCSLKVRFKYFVSMFSLSTLTLFDVVLELFSGKTLIDGCMLIVPLLSSSKPFTREEDRFCYCGFYC
jgi:hypothetical protein